MHRNKLLLPPLRLRAKILLLAVVPLLVAMGALAYTVYQQGLALAQQQKQLVAQAWFTAKEAELQQYVRLAQSAIAPLVKQGDTPALRAEALALLAQMEFGRDGYFFVYDLDGRSLMHPRQPELVGRDLAQLRDGLGNLVLQPLLALARVQGVEGGVVRYRWHKPSAQRESEKLGYVVAVPPWGWMLGTGIYLDDIEATLADIDLAAQANIRDMLAWIVGIGAIGTLLVGACGLALNISDQRQSDTQLRRLAQQLVQSQETERARLSRELHDGVNQLLVSAKLLLEAALARLRQLPLAQAGNASDASAAGGSNDDGRNDDGRNEDGNTAAGSAAEGNTTEGNTRDSHPGAHPAVARAPASESTQATAKRVTATAPGPDFTCTTPPSPDRTAPVREPIEAALSRLHASVAEMRRISHNLRPSLLDDLGLPAALAQLAQEFAPASAAASIEASVQVDGTARPLPDAYNTALFRVAQEALTNVAHHARASHVTLHLDYGPRHVALLIRDDGQGFDLAQVQQQPHDGIGLRNMRERIEPLGGTLVLRTNARGTQVQATLPLSSRPPA